MEQEKPQRAELTDLISMKTKKDVLDLLIVPTSLFRHVNWSRLRQSEGKLIGITYATLSVMELGRALMYVEVAYKIAYNQSLIQKIYNYL